MRANAMRQRVDGVVDWWFGEKVELHPWIRPDVSGDGMPDPDRSIRRTRGCYVTPGAEVVGEGGTQGAGSTTRIVQSDIWLSITKENLGGDPWYWRSGDRVLFGERGEWFEITFIAPSATFRHNVNLVRIKAPVI
jgi:hypothetical protein